MTNLAIWFGNCLVPVTLGPPANDVIDLTGAEAKERF